MPEESPARESVEFWVQRLGLKPHPEGGFYRETYRSPLRVPTEALPDAFQGERNLCTVILFLLPRNGVSRLHRLKSDEIWFYHAGNPVRLHFLFPNGRYVVNVLGAGPENGQAPQILVPRGTWLAAEAPGPAGFALAACLVAPGFEFADFELGERDVLLQRFPEHRDLVLRFTLSKNDARKKAGALEY